MSKIIKRVIMFVVIGSVLVALYYFFNKPKVPNSNLTSGSVTNTAPGITPGNQTNTNSALIDAKAKENSALAKEFLALLLSVRSIALDNVIFYDPAFVALKDSTIVLVNDGNEGRLNPFAPIGQDQANNVIVPENTNGVDINSLDLSEGTDMPSLPIDNTIR